MEKAKRKQIPNYTCFIDLKAAYDTVNREALWKVLLEYGLPNKVYRLIKCFYEGSSASVRSEGCMSDWFEVSTGLRQGYLLSPALFNVFIDFVVRRALAGMEKYGVKIQYKMPDGRMSRGDLVEDEERLKALLYADDLVIISESEEGLKEFIESMEDQTQKWGLTICVKNKKCKSTARRKRIRI